jgi:Mn-dependent DtxR family transcriptional regulator
MVMPSSSDMANRSTAVLVKAGEILRKLAPSTLAALFFVLEDNTRTQAEMADMIGVSRSSMSKYLRTLSDLPLTLITKQRGRRYTVTDEGKKVISLIEEMVDTPNLELRSVDWENESDREQVATRLAPLHGSRSDRTFFVLDALRLRSGSVNPYTSPSRVWIEDIVHDVDARGENATTERVRQTLRRYDEAGAIEFDGEYVKLTDEGQEQAQLLDQLANRIEQQGDQDTADRQLATDPVDDRSETDNISGQMRRRGFHGGGQRAAEAGPSASSLHELPSIVPAYCLTSTTHETINGSQTQSDPLPVLPLEAMTIGELTDAVTRLNHEYDEDAHIEPYWTLQTETGLFPLGPAQLSATSDDV